MVYSISDSMNIQDRSIILCRQYGGSYNDLSIKLELSVFEQDGGQSTV